MTRILRTLLLLLALSLSGYAAHAQKKPSKPPPPTTTTQPTTLILHDAPPGTAYEKLGQTYGIMLQNLLGHFDAQVQLVPVQNYTAGMMQNFDATFYLGTAYDNPLPRAFLNDAAATTRKLVWFRYNLWQLAADPTYNFSALRGFTFEGLRGLNAVPTAADPAPGFFDTVQYKNLNFVKYYEYDANRDSVAADPDIGVVGIVDAAKAQAVVPVTNARTGETVPYVTRSGNFWYVADIPFSFIGPRDRYLVISDLLHDMLEIHHAENHRAMVRLEDVGALVNPQSMSRLADHLHARRIPFSIAVIPLHRDPLGVYNNGVPMTVRLSEATNLKNSLNYAVARGGQIVMHGYTHQYGEVRNPHTGVSGDDYEFWNIVSNSPVAEDSTRWALNRLRAGLKDLQDNGFTAVAWETPHYHASALSSKAVPQVFKTTYQRVVYFTADRPNFFLATGRDYAAGQIFPYPIRTDVYGQRVLPENLGNIEYDIREIDPTSFYNYTWEDIALNARYAKSVRDGFASFFFHPFWLEPALNRPGFEDFKKTLDAIEALGFTWVAPTGIPQ